jgi:hypothetical protein
MYSMSIVMYGNNIQNGILRIQKPSQYVIGHPTKPTPIWYNDIINSYKWATKSLNNNNVIKKFDKNL